MKLNLKKVFDIKNNFDFFVVKTKFKHLVRTIGYSRLVTELITQIITLYIKLVYFTCKKTFINEQVFLDRIRQNQSSILVAWHSHLLMLPSLSFKMRQANSSHKYFSLASKHGDGRFVSKTVAKFGTENIHGSSALGRKGRGIDIANFRKLLKALKNNGTLIITPDGPRGPRHKINSQIVNIAGITGAPIITFSYSCSQYFQLNTWDKFIIPLPFSRICYHFGETNFIKNLKYDKNQIKKINSEIAQKINLSISKSKQIIQ